MITHAVSDVVSILAFLLHGLGAGVCKLLACFRSAFRIGRIKNDSCLVSFGGRSGSKGSSLLPPAVATN
jgi:hypothetical protein